MRRVALAASLGLLLAGVAVAAPGYDWKLPPGVKPPPVPKNNPMTAAKVELGRRLFYDADLSINGTTSCATCHEQHRAFTEGNANHPGVNGAAGKRNVQALANVAYFQTLTWADSSQHQLESQSLVPIMGLTPVEMGMAGQEKELARRLESDPCYQQMFAAAFPSRKGKVDMLSVTQALASFERTLISKDAPYDRYQKGDKTALSDAAQRGAKAFTDLGCSGCHSGSDFTDGKFHNIGLYNEGGTGGYPDRDQGLRDFTGKASDEGMIRTPSLRNVALSDPYMHDGSIRPLRDAILRHFGNASPLTDAKLKGAGPSAVQADDLVAFLQSLTDKGFVTNPDLALPRMACGKPL